jgi:cell division protein FtsQ
MWIAIGGGLFTLLMAAIGKKNKGSCAGMVITLNGQANDLFISQTDINFLLEAKMGGPAKGQAIAAFNLRSLETELEMSEWIDHAEMYFDNRDVLHVSISEKIPVARIFTMGDRSFYIDSLGNSMPLSDKKTARVPVFTGFPHKNQLSARDSSLLNEIREVASFIVTDSFWHAQVSQIDILPDRSFEMIPVIGDHRVKLGSSTQIAAKFRRLSIFYKHVLKHTGMNAYRVIDVQYKGQVVASRQDKEGRIDSARLRNNVEKMLRRSREVTRNSVTQKPGDASTPHTDARNTDDDLVKPRPADNNDPNAVKTNSVSLPDAREKVENKTNPPPEKRIPKAVMSPRRPAAENNNNAQ